MWFDETPRLLTVADILQKKKNKDDNYEFDDFPDVKAQSMTGKYDNNFDAPGSDFERAHNYNLNNIQQPENTKSDVDYSNKYNHFLKYEPSTYVRLEEDEYKPFTKSDEKANEYYIDNLKGKTLDDLIISKMKENAGAEDLPRDAARRQFAEDLLRNEPELHNNSSFMIDGLNLTASQTTEYSKNKVKDDKKNALNRLNARGPPIIAAPILSAPPQKPPKPAKSSGPPQKPPKPAKSSGDILTAAGGGGRQKTVQDALEQDNRRSLRLQGTSGADVSDYSALESKRKKPVTKDAVVTNEVTHYPNDDEKSTFNKNLNRTFDKEMKEKQLKGGLSKFRENVARKKIKKDKAQTTIAAAYRRSQAQKQLQDAKQAQTTIAAAFRGRRAKKQVQDLHSKKEVNNTLKDIIAKVEDRIKEEESKEEKPKDLILKTVTQRKKPSPAKSVITDATEVLPFNQTGGGGGEISIPVSRGQHQNTREGLERHQQSKLESKFPAVEQYKKDYSKMKKDTVVSIDVIRQYNKDVSPETNLKTSVAMTVEDFLKSIDKEYERRKPKSQQPKLTAEAIAQSSATPSKTAKVTATERVKKANNSGGHSPLRDMLGL